MFPWTWELLPFMFITFGIYPEPPQQRGSMGTRQSTGRGASVAKIYVGTDFGGLQPNGNGCQVAPRTVWKIIFTQKCVWNHKYPSKSLFKLPKPKKILCWWPAVLEYETLLQHWRMVRAKKIRRWGRVCNEKAVSDIIAVKWRWRGRY